MKAQQDLINTRCYVSYLKSEKTFEQKYPYKFCEHFLWGNSWKSSINSDAQKWAKTDIGKHYIALHANRFDTAVIKYAEFNKVHPG